MSPEHKDEVEPLSVDEKYEKFKKIDPFPSISPSLLNSADIEDYVKTAGMIHPFCSEDLKSASYTARIKGEVIWWEGNRRRRRILINEDEQNSFQLRPNSIAFIEVEPYFRLPDYIAVRFNLTITNVYRGLLLGTGPLVDPGFVGKIYIPLHNLTANTYEFRYHDKLIWIEFTKTSPILDSAYEEEASPVQVKTDLEMRKGKYIPFPPEKTAKDLNYYFYHAAEDMEIISSIPEVMQSAKASSKKAENAAKTARNINYGIALGFLITLALMLFSVWSAFQSYNDNVVKMRDETQEVRLLVEEQKSMIEQLQERIDAPAEQVTLDRGTLEGQIEPIQAPETAVSETRTGGPVE